jgi:nitrite reductase/ring-hydroxylating ferredoxin subunit
MADWRKVAEYSELEEGKITAVRIDGNAIALYKIGGQVFATFDTCTHDDCSLEDFGKVEGEEVECTCHGARFKIRTGEVTRPPALMPLKVYKAEVQGEDILVEV